MRFEDEFTVDKTPDEVFCLLADAERIPEWMVEFERVEQISNGESEPGVGTEYRCRPSTLHAETGRSSGPSTSRASGWRTRETRTAPSSGQGATTSYPSGGDDTTVRMVIEPRFGWPMKLVSPLLGLLLRKHARRDATALRRWLSSAAVALGVMYTNAVEMLDGFSQWAVGLSGAL